MLNPALTPAQPNLSPTGGNIYDKSAAALDYGTNVYGRVGAGGAPVMSMNAYLNPYQQQVIDNTLSRMDDVYKREQMRVGDAAEAADAFGSGRHGLVEAENASNYMRAVGDTAGQLNQQGFDRAASLGMQDVQQQLAAAAGLGNMSNLGFGFGQSIKADQMQEGNLQQQLLQTILGLAEGDYQQYTQYPQQRLAPFFSALSGSPLIGNSTQTYNPGIFDYLALAAQTGGRIGQGYFGR